MKKEDLFNERLQYLIDNKKISQVVLAKGIGVNEARITGWLNRSVKSPRRTTFQKLADFFDCSIDWIAEGKGEPFPPKKDSSNGDIILKAKNSIQAGHQIIGGKQSVMVSPGPEIELVGLDKDERELIFLLREVGGKMTLRKFVAELEKIKLLLSEQG